MRERNAQPFLHARVIAELPFRLALPSGLYPFQTSAQTAMPVVVRGDASWLVGYEPNREAPSILRRSRHFGTADNVDAATDEIVRWLDSSGLEKAVILPASTILELWIGFTSTDFPEDVEVWSNAPRIRELFIFLINQFLTRYRAAYGFTPPAGNVGSVSELELRQLYVQLFSDDSPQSRADAVVPSLPAHPTLESFASVPDAVARFKEVLHLPAVPLWLELAHDAHSLLYRRRHEQCIMTWIQALEVAVAQIAEHTGVQLKARFRLTDELLATLRAEKVPHTVLDGLEELKDREFDEARFKKALVKVLDRDKRAPFSDLIRVRDLILNQAKLNGDILEEHLAKLIDHGGIGPLAPDLRNKLADARKLRNRVVHYGQRLPFDDTQAQAVTKAAIEALALIEEVAKQGQIRA